jgi:hypothetical protein
MGFRVGIGHQKGGAQRVREIHGEAVVWMTSDEVAAIIANLDAFKPVAAIKRLFPGAEILALGCRYQRMASRLGLIPPASVPRSAVPDGCAERD